METVGVTTIDPWFLLEEEPLIKNLYYFDKLVYCLDGKETLEKVCKAISGDSKHFTDKMKEIEILENFGLLTEYSHELYMSDKEKFSNDHAANCSWQAYELASEFLKS